MFGVDASVEHDLETVTPTLRKDRKTRTTATPNRNNDALGGNQMTHFMQAEDDFYPAHGQDSVRDRLPVGNYVIAANPSGLYFHRVPMFEPAKKVYGGIEAKADRILETFQDRPRATGVLFAGEKGSGKTQLARIISQKAYDLDMPTILINAPWHGDAFNSLLAQVTQPVVVLMDEFEKVYDTEQQDAVLTLLDGAMTTKKLFVLTVNDTYKVNTHMKNRPGRLYYALDFDGLESEFVREYCEDNLDEKSHIETVVTISSIFEKFNFDMLKALVEEMNRYGEDPYQAMEMLNIKPPSYSSSSKYDVKVWNPEGVEAKVDRDMEALVETPIHSRQGSVWIGLETEDEDERDEETDRERGIRRMFEPDGIVVNATDLTKLNGEKGIFEFVNAKGFRVVFTRQETQPMDLRAMHYAY